MMEKKKKNKSLNEMRFWIFFLCNKSFEVDSIRANEPLAAKKSDKWSFCRKKNFFLCFVKLTEKKQYFKISRTAVVDVKIQTADRDWLWSNSSSEKPNTNECFMAIVELELQVGEVEKKSCEWKSLKRNETVRVCTCLSCPREPIEEEEKKMTLL